MKCADTIRRGNERSGSRASVGPQPALHRVCGCTQVWPLLHPFLLRPASLRMWKQPVVDVSCLCDLQRHSRRSQRHSSSRPGAGAALRGHVVASTGVVEPHGRGAACCTCEEWALSPVILITCFLSTVKILHFSFAPHRPSW